MNLDMCLVYSKYPRTFLLDTAGHNMQDMQPVISVESLPTDELTQILHAHWLFCTAVTPLGKVYALEASKLFVPDITVFGARINGELVGVGAMRRLDDEHAELKSMHTLEMFRGLGIGKAIVSYIEDYGRGLGINQLSLETGTNEAFAPARELYKSLGYINSGAFGDYVLSDFNTCMTKFL